MDEDLQSSFVADGVIRGIKFSVASFDEVCTYSINDCPISHSSQLNNPFLGLPLESGKCESCGSAELGKCEGHFGYIQLPVPVYHPSHICELKDILSFVCLKCMRITKAKVKDKVSKSNVSTASCKFCRDLPIISIKVKTSDGASYLELSVPSRTRLRENFWNFLDRFGFHHGEGTIRTLLPFEALNILKEIPEETQKKLSAKGYFPQNGYILQYLPVPPNCLLVPEISDGKSVMSSDISMTLLKRVLNKIDLIKRSRSGSPNFESHLAESNDLQLAIAEYMHLRGTTKAPHDITRNFARGREASANSGKQWVEKMKTLFISKGSGFSSRSVITGDAYIGIHEIGLPSEIAKKVTFEERVTVYNLERLQKMVDSGLCVTYKDGNFTYAIAVGSKGHTQLKVGQIINRSIVDGDTVFINRPPSTHKHSLQAFSVYVHDDHTVKISPLVCAPLGADFDGDCIHIFYPQSFAAKAEVLELFGVEQQLLSSHNGKLNLQLVSDSLLSLKVMANTVFLKRETAQQLGMFVTPILPLPAVVRACNSGPLWTIHQILQSAFPSDIDCVGERHLINQSQILKFEFDRDLLQSSLTEIITSALVTKGPRVALNLFNTLQPLLMEILSLEGFSVNLEDFYVARACIQDMQSGVQEISSLCGQLKASYNELLELQIENQLRNLKLPFVSFILESSCMGYLIDSKSESSIGKVLQQVGFLGLQLSDRGKLYSRVLVQDIFSYAVNKCSVGDSHPPSEAYGLVKGSFFGGLKPFEALVHSISTREVMLRSSRGLTEPGTLFKDLMAILRDVVICYDDTVRNVCTNSLIQFEYGLDRGSDLLGVSAAGEPVGALAATAIANVAYKAVLDSSKSTISSWELMKEILVSKANYKNDVVDRRVILYLNDCSCGKKFCRENAALSVQNCLRRTTLRHCAIDFSIEYQKQINVPNNAGFVSGLVGHIHLDMVRLQMLNQTTDRILHKCQEVVLGHTRKKSSLSHVLKRIFLSASECCSQHSDDGNLSHFPCLQFSYSAANVDETLEQGIHNMANIICPVLLDSIIKGDTRVESVNIVWVVPDSISWVRNPNRTLRGELALEVVVQKTEARQSGDAWRTVLDACLPVMHLIDTTRSIPYGIQQMKEAFGISCGFDQIVQRLSKTIKTKGVINEHLILVANSITCTGKLIGFNTGGFKALFKSLKVQVPFTEATKCTPMRCFERAAEKCHTDSLGSVVASSAWGKHVSIGTGTHFEVMWGQKHQVAGNEDIGKDVYDVLAWVREPRERSVSGACVGSEVDDLLDEIQPDDVPLSPEPDIPYEKPMFDDYIQSESMNASDNWETRGNKEMPSAEKSGNWDVWGNKDTSAAGKSESWDVLGGKNKAATEKSDSWGAAKLTKQVNNSEAQAHSPWSSRKPESESSSGWDANWGKKAQGAAMESGWNESAAIQSNSTWMPKKPAAAEKPNNSGSWGNRDTPVAGNSGWNESAAADQSNTAWMSKKPAAEKPNNSASWGNRDVPAAGKSGWNESAADQSNSTWMPKKPAAEKLNNSESWGKKDTPSTGKSGWSESTADLSNTAWMPKKPAAEKSNNLGSWGNRDTPAVGKPGLNESAAADESNTTWMSKKPAAEKPNNSVPWGSRDTPAASKSVSFDVWGQKDNKVTKTEVDSSSGWNDNVGQTKKPENVSPGNLWTPTSKKPEVDSSKGWNDNGGQTKKPENQSTGWGTGNQGTSTGKKPEVDISPGWKDSAGQAWEAKKPENGSSGWSTPTGKKPEVDSSRGWKETGGQAWDTKKPENESSEWSTPAGKKPEVDSSHGWNESGGQTWETKKLELESSGWSADNPWTDTTPATPNSSGWNDRRGSQGWKSQGRGSGRGQGRGQGREGRGQGRDSPRPPGGRTVGGGWRRAETFTTEEEKILIDVEPAMNTIRKILRESSEGGRLSSDDQKFIVENVFQFHPDRQAKVTDQIDYIMVDKHENFKDSRCFFVVSSDGSRADFSYIKCMENFVKDRYPEHSESFNRKFFKRRRAEQPPNSDEQLQQPRGETAI